MSNLRGFIVFLLLAPLPVYACNLDFALTPTPISVVYEPFSSIGAVGKTEFRLNNRGLEEEFILTLRNLDVAQANDFSVAFEASTADSQLRTIEEDRFQLQLPSGESKPITFNALISHAAVPSSGFTEITYELAATSAQTGLSCWDEVYLTVQINAPSRAQLNIAGTDTAYENGPDLYHLDFGPLKEGLRRRVYLQLRANEDVIMTLDSANKGRMTHTSLSKHGVDYEFLLSGNAVDLTNRAVLTLPAAPTFRGVSLPVDITIGEVDRVPSGDYEDTITIEVSAL